MADDPSFAALGRALADIGLERGRQVIEEGFTTDSDDAQPAGRLAAAAGAYAVHWAIGMQMIHSGEAKPLTPAEIKAQVAAVGPPEFWPMDRRAWKPTLTRHDLVRAAALLVAEIERMDRQKQETHCWCDRHKDWETVEEFLNCERAAKATVVR